MDKKSTKRLTAIICMLAIFFGCLPTVYADESEFLSDYSSVPGWQIDKAYVDGGGYIDSTEHASGNNSMKLYNNTPQAHNVYLRATYPVSVKKGASYHYGFKVKAKNAFNVATMMDWGTRSSLLPSGGTAGWREFEFNYTHTTDASVALLSIILDAKTEGIWIDDLYYYEDGDSTHTNLIKNASFEDTAANIPSNTQNGEDRPLIAVSHRNSIQIDGDLSDWSGVEPMKITQKTVYQGDVTIDADIRYAYDDDNFYFAVEVEDNVHYPVMEGQYWTGDGIQFTLCGTNDTYGEYYAFSYNPEDNTKFTNSYDNLKYGFKRNGTTSIYEVAIPWTDYFDDGKHDAALFCLIVNDNDNDGLGRKGCLMVTEGIAAYKDSKDFPMFLMADNVSGYTGWLSGTKECYIGETAEYYVDLFNSSDKEISINLKSEKAGIDETVKISAGVNERYDFAINYKNMGEETVDMIISDGTTEKRYETKTIIHADEEKAKEVIAKHKAEYEELVPLMNECKDKGFNLDYDEINYNILGHFVTYMEENLKKNDNIRVYHQDEVLTELYEKTKTNLTSYLNGTKTPLSAPTYVTSDISVVDKHFEATVDNDGKLERQPVFFVGTGHWAPSRKDIPILSKFGFNAIQPELGGWDFMSKAMSVQDWTSYSNGYKCTDEVSSSVKHDGDYALKLSSNNDHIDNCYWYMYQDIEVKPNTTYEYGLWAKADNAKFTWYSIDPKWTMDRRHWMEGTYDWREDAHQYTTGPNETSIRFLIFNEEKTSAFYVDDVYLREKGTDKNLIVNGDFEKINENSAYWEIDEDKVNNLAKDFDLMAKHNLSGVFSTAPHYVPNNYRQDYPEINSMNQNQFSTQTILAHPLMKEYYDTYYRTVMPRLANKPAFDSIVLMNEPVYYTYMEPYYLPLFQEEMKKKYGNIKSLNEKWGTEYKSFDKIDMPTGLEATPRFYDWCKFNDKVLPEYNKFVSDIIKQYDSNVLTQTKVMQTMHVGRIDRVDASNSWEDIAPTIDINGCDGWSYYKSTESDIRTQNCFYDYQTSVKNAPTYNAEDHIIPDNTKMTFSDEELAYNIATLWQGAVHGRGGSIIWFWDREQRSESGNYLHNPLLTERPDTVAAIGKMTLDLNRLAKEVVSITESKANIGMLYAEKSYPYALDYMNYIYAAYSKLGENGQRTQFIVESAMNNLNDIKCLIVPHVVALKNESFDAIRAFADKGGKVIILGKDSLTKDEYGNDRDADKVAALMSKAEIVDIASVGTTLDAASISKIGDTISNVVKTENYSDISVIDKETGKPLTDCEYLYSQNEGKYIVNLCTYRDDDREIEIYVKGKKAENFTDLISTETYKGNALAKAYTPMLIRIEG